MWRFVALGIRKLIFCCPSGLLPAVRSAQWQAGDPESQVLTLRDSRLRGNDSLELVQYSRNNFIILILTLAPFISTAQDIHFSQFNATPLNINPALTGSFDGDYRFIGNQRTQWRSVSSNPYRTFGFSADAANVLKKKDYHAGIALYNDKTGDSHFSTLQINLAASRDFFLKDSMHKVSVGFQSGFTQRKIDYSGLRFDNQYNGNFYEEALTTGENFVKQGYLNLNLNLGAAWFHRVSERLNVSSGIALYNLNKPRQTFFSDNSIRLDRRLTFFSRGDYILNNDFSLLPSLLLMKQGRYKEFVLGSAVKYTIEDIPGSYRAARFGVWYRTKDAGFLVVGMDYNNINVGISYDFTLSGLNPASRYRGGFEVSVIYIIKKITPVLPKYKTCPSFI